MISETSIQLNDDLKEFRVSIPQMLSIIDRASKGIKPGLAMDYGCGPGVWSVCLGTRYDKVIGIDILESSLEAARKLALLNQQENVTLLNFLNSPTLPPAPVDLMIAIDVVEVMRSEHIHAMFQFAATHLGQGGRFLMTSRRPAGYIDALLSLSRFRHDGLLGGLRRYAALTRSVVEALTERRIDRGLRARFYHHPNAILSLADEYGLCRLWHPKELENDPVFGAMDLHFWKPETQGFRSQKHLDWYLFEKKAG